MHPHHLPTHCIPLLLHCFDKNNGASFRPIVKKKPIWNPIVQFWIVILFCLKVKKNLHGLFLAHVRRNVQLIFPPKLLTTSRAFKGHSIYSSFFFKTILLTKHWLLSKKRENPWHVRFSSQLTVLVTYYRHILGFSRPKILLPKHFDSVWRKSGSAQDVAVKKK